MTYQPRLMRNPNPNRAVIVNSRHATPIGATFMTMSMTFAMTLNTPSSSGYHRRGALARHQRQRRAEHDREEHDADHVGRRSRHRFERIRRHERAHERHERRFVRRRRRRHLLRRVGVLRHQQIARRRIEPHAGTDGVGEQDAEPDRHDRNRPGRSRPCARPLARDAARRRCRRRRR